uniref:HTH_Tnp_Tc3_2 domain-containing protein n=1 Tax=Caenorhabditis japonica TaxID=281687 RepID=A0A8R1E508_CAEJA
MVIIRGRQMGLDMPTLAKQFKTSKSVIWATLNTPDLSKATGRLLKTSSGDDRIIVRMTKKNPRQTSTDINSELKDQYGVQVSKDTVKRRLRHDSLFRRRSVNKPMIPEKNRSAGLNCFHANGVGFFIRITGTMESYMYKDILEKEMIPSGRSQMCRGWLFQQDNDRNHSSHYFKDWIAQHRVNVMT